MWNRTEHVSIIGDTGSGKTYLENLLLKKRGYVVFLRTKAEDPHDDPMDSTWRRVSSVKEISTLYPYWLLDPPYEYQGREGQRLFDKARVEHNWTLAIDELLGAVDVGLEKRIRWGLTQGRSSGITMVVGTQRPTTGTPIMRYVFSQSTHAFIFSIDGRDAEQIVYKSFSPRLAEAIPKLDFKRHQFVYYHRRERRVIIASANDIERFM
jgi:hypothetical protein